MTDDPLLSNIIDLTTARNRPTKIGVIIQARMSSKRFPGKSMALLRGAPVLEHVIKNCQAIKQATQVILAVPDTDDSEPMLQLADSLGIQNFCGKEYDVLNRYYEASKFFDLDIIVRITGDCPFLNPVVCSETIDLLKSFKCDYVSNAYPKRTYPKGMDCEVMTREALDASELSVQSFLDQQGRYDREHVTTWLQRTEGIRKANLIQQEDHSAINVCVDYPEDIARLEPTQLKVVNEN